MNKLTLGVLVSFTYDLIRMDVVSEGNLWTPP